MAYKLVKAKFRNKNIPFESFELETKPGEITDIFCDDKQVYKFIKNALKGKYKIDDGRFMIDEIDAANYKYIRSKTTFIKSGDFLSRFIPPKLTLSISQMFDLNFLRIARQKRIDKLYNYKSFKKSKNDVEDMKLRRTIDQEISQFISSFTEIEDKLLNDFKNNILAFNKKKYKQIANEISTPQLKILINEILRIELNIYLNDLLLMFTQSLYDKIYTLYDLRSSCTCEYNIKYSSNKNLRKDSRKFSYNQQKFMVKKNLKNLLVQINEIRITNYKEQRNLKYLMKEKKLEEKRIISKKILEKTQIDLLKENVLNWKKVILEQGDDFLSGQKDFFFNIIEKKSIEVEERTIFLIHKYHQKLISDGVTLGDAKNYKILLKFYKSEIIPVMKQSKIQQNLILKNLDIKFNPFLLGYFKLSNINTIFLKIIRAINLNKWDIIVSNDVIRTLTRNDFKIVLKLLENIKATYPKLSFIFLNETPYDLNSLKKEVYAFNDGKIKLIPFSNLMIEEKTIILDKWNKYGFNLVKYSKNDLGISIGNKTWMIEDSRINDRGNIIINPFNISTKEIGEELFDLFVAIKRQTKFNDTNVKYGITDKGEKIFFYSDKEYLVNQKVQLFFDKTAIIEIL